MRHLTSILLFPLAGLGTAWAADSSLPDAQLFAALDRDHSGSLDIDEFLAGFGKIELLEAPHAAKLGRQFALMDRNRDGRLSEAEFISYYQPKVTSRPPSPPSPPAAKKTGPASAPHGDDEEDVPDTNLVKKITLHPWTEFQRRSIENTFLPAAATIERGHFHYRIIHVAREAWYEDTTTNLLGLDDSVKIGFQLGYGITDHLDINVTRSNGRTLQLSGRPINMDYWDALLKYRLMDQNDHGIADLSVVGGATVMLRNHGRSDVSLDTQVVLERNFIGDRLRLGVGVARAGLSAYEPIVGIGPGIKFLPEEYDQQVAATPSTAVPARATTAIPLTVKVSLTERWQWFGDAIFPIQGFRTDQGGPSVATGLRFNTHTHEYSFYFTNTANTAFNAVITGGAAGGGNLPVFGFSIVAYL